MLVFFLVWQCIARSLGEGLVSIAVEFRRDLSISVGPVVLENMLESEMYGKGKPEKSFL